LPVLARLAGWQVERSCLWSTALDFTARYRKFLTFSVIFRLLLVYPIWVKQAVEVLVLCFYCNCVCIYLSNQGDY